MSYKMKLYPNEEHPLLYLSGSSTGEDHEKALVKHGCTHRCYSFGYVAEGAFNYVPKMQVALETSLKLGVGVMMDSSAASFHVLARKRKVGKHSREDIEKLRDTLVGQYVAYAKTREKSWDWCVSFDYTHDAEECWRMQKLLEKRGLHPVPVYHRGQDLDWFIRYCKEGYKLIGIGGIAQRTGYVAARRMIDKTFDAAAKYGVKLHGFAVTSLSTMLMYPWHSVDSASWVKIAAYGSVLHVDERRGVVSELHLTNRNATGKTKYAHLSRELRKQVKQEVEENGFKLKELCEDYHQRSLYNVHMYTQRLGLLKELVCSGRKRWRSLLT